MGRGESMLGRRLLSQRIRAVSGTIPRSSIRGALTHVGEDGRPQMVDVSSKTVTQRFAHARSTVVVPPNIAALLQTGGDIQSKKGPVFATAIIAGTMGAKRTSELIPFCHPLPLEDCKVEIAVPSNGGN